MLFRASAIAPVNIPLVSLMISVPASNVPMTLFLHFANQSYNTACNYANRSGATMSNTDILSAYSLAVTSACTLAFGLGRLVQKGPPVLKRFGILIPMIATSAANISNIALTRSSEMINGVPVSDGSGQLCGTSKVAGVQGVFQSAITRCILVPISCLLLPPAVMSVLKKLNMLPKNLKLVTAIEIGIILLLIIL